MTGTPGSVGRRLEGMGVRAVSLDLFGTLVTVATPTDPVRAVAESLRDRGVALPRDWETAYRTAYLDAEPLEEVPLQDHVRALFEARADELGAVPSEDQIDEALHDAFDTPIQTREGAVETVTALAAHVPVGILSNSSVEGLVDRTIRRSELRDAPLAVIRSSVDIGWRKPHERAFEAIAADLGSDLEGLLHVGDDVRTDGGAERAGGRSVIVQEDGPLDLDSILEGP